MRPGPSSERAVILSPRGRDGEEAARQIRAAGLYVNVCADFPALVREVESGAGVAVIDDEAIKTADLRPLVTWLTEQPSWSDFPIVLLRDRTGEPARDPEAARLVQLLGNVSFIERPFHPTTLISIVGSAIRGRRRQYETRAILQNLIENQTTLQTALDVGRLGAVEMNIPERRLEASDTFKSFFGREPSGSLTFEEMGAAIHPDDRERNRKAFDRALKNGADYNIEYRAIWPDNSVHWINTHATIFRDLAGRPATLIGVASDVTARKLAEIEREKLVSQLAAERGALADLTATLEQRVDQRTAELMQEVAAREKAQEQLRQAQKMETIGQLTGGVAHDFNNLLMVVVGNLELLRKRVPNDPRLHRLIDGALQGAERGASLTQRLLAFARQQDLNPAPVDLGQLLRGMSDLLERSLGSRIVLRLAVADDLPPAAIDANQLELAILNLAINARDAMADGGTIDIKVARFRVTGDPELRSGNYLKVTVRDTGSGMPPDILAKAIDPFFSTKPLGKGTGLGLSMVHGLAVQLGGALQLSSVVGKGTTAALILPIATAPVAAGNRTPSPPKPPRSAVILFVDDDPLIAMSTMEMLEDLGHRVIGASSGPHALDILRSDQPIDLMMTDHLMPGMTGIELAAASRQVRPRLPVLLATGYADLPEGVSTDVPRLAKPYHQEQLRDRLEQLLG
ncbi:MAG: PAS domain-containing protein [Xanthobacteraceae bacterium]|nr:PAS domain-containing protein [Xanthobacteraceae bacterium]